MEIKHTDNQLLAVLKEVRGEISRVNQAAGETVFNPAITQMVDAEIANPLNAVASDVLEGLKAMVALYDCGAWSSVNIKAAREAITKATA